MNGSDLDRNFPNLNVLGYSVTSPETIDYNCIAWAIGDMNEWWEPDIFNQYYWPPGVTREYTLEAYRMAFESVGFVVCQDGSYETGYEKVAIYADAMGIPKHAARQLPSGVWTSKLGKNVDIEHPVLESLYGPAYGSAALFMKKRI